MYTDKMRHAFRSIYAPKNFSVDIIDNDSFLTVRANEKQFINLGHDDKIQAVQYMINVKKALEYEGAIVLLVRKGIGD